MLPLKFKRLFALGNLFIFSLACSQSYAAAVIDPTTEPVYVLPPYAVSSNDVSSGTVKAYRPWFENGTWQGDLIEYDVSTGGILSTTVDATVFPPTTSSPGNWSARIQFASNVSSDVNYWKTGANGGTRKIITSTTGTNQIPFDWASLTSVQQTALDSVAVGAATSDMLDYLRGDQSNETDKTDGLLRQRFSLLGDILHSNPVYVAAPDTDFSASPVGYYNFKSKAIADTPSGQSDRAPRVYVSANDGMVHAFDAATGNEVWAYVPSIIIGDLDKRAADPFAHTYFVDGALSEGDADFDTDPDDAASEWHTLLVGGLGSGGKGLFALDITSASLSAETANTGDNRKILWEKDGSDADMGYIHGAASIARLGVNHNYKWVVITGNGYSSTGGEAKLLMYDMAGSITKKDTDSSTSNGLSAPALVDDDNDGNVDYAYAGDLQGNMWKFDLRPNPITVTLLYADPAGAAKPITTEPDVRIHPNGGRLVYYGTGSLLSATDAKDTSLQSVFGIWDGTSNTTILTQTLSTEDYTYDPGTGNVTVSTRTSTNNVVDWAEHKGWKVDLNISGERLVSNPIMRADRLQFISHNPLTSDRGDAWSLELNYLNGGTGSGVFLDLNRDSDLTDDDKIAPVAPATVGKIPVGVNIGEGSFSGPVISRVTNSRDTKFVNGLFLAAPAAPKTENTHFQGGHMDVDTDGPQDVAQTAPTIADSYCYKGPRTDNIPVDSAGNPIPPSTNSPLVRTGTTGGDGLGGQTDAHVHEYDIKHNQVYVDYLNLEPLCGQGENIKHNRVTEMAIAYSKKFLILIANADLSPGATLQIGTKKWNVVVYQKLLHEKLDAWIAAGSVTTGNSATSFNTMMVDEDGASLQYTIDGIKAAGTLRNAFNDRAILDGGLHATNTGCVKGDPYDNLDNPGAGDGNTGRWRGGALNTQLIGVTEYLADLTTIVKQTPTDLDEYVTIDGVNVYLKADNIDASVDPAIAGTDGVYETFTAGGLRARDKVAGAIANNPAYLYESTLFWHYDGSPCYGEDGYDEAVIAARSASPTDTLSADLAEAIEKLADKEEKLAEKLQDLADEIAGENRADKIEELEEKVQKERDKVAEKEAEIERLNDALADDNVANTGLPTPPVDADANIAPALGPNFRTGRRTWIDLTP